MYPARVAIRTGLWPSSIASSSSPPKKPAPTRAAGPLTFASFASFASFATAATGTRSATSAAAAIVRMLTCMVLSSFVGVACLDRTMCGSRKAERTIRYGFGQRPVTRVCAGYRERGSAAKSSSGRAASTSIAWLHASGSTHAGLPARSACSGSKSSSVRRERA